MASTCLARAALTSFLKNKERCGIPVAKEGRDNCGICLLPIIPTQPKEDSSCRLFGLFPTKRINGLNF